MVFKSKKLFSFLIFFYFFCNIEGNAKDTPSSFADLAERLMLIYRIIANISIIFILLVFPNSLAQSKNTPSSFADLAEKQSQIMKGEGDGQRNKIFADAFEKDPEFFAFYRAMQAYEKALIGGDTSLVLSPDSEFFKFFGNIKPQTD